MKMVETSGLIKEVSEYMTVDVLWGFVKKTGYLLYIMNPKEHLFEKVEEVPDYFKEAAHAFILAIVLEMVLRFLTGRSAFRVNDTITNISQGILTEVIKVPFLGAEVIVYTWIYNNYPLIPLPWDSAWTWLLGIVFADFCFYWTHRLGHTVSFLWAIHEVHHSSEEYNVTVPMRLNVINSALMWYGFLPMAFAFPPQVFLVHYQMVIVYQQLLHTEVCPRLPYVDWILNTPRLHRIHHGRNRRFIDKNFASVFTIWDRMFGTFEPDTDEDIRYGLTTPLQTFNHFLIQTNHLRAMYKKFNEIEGTKNKLLSLVKGPGWLPGKPWRGNLEDIREPSPDDKKYDPQIPAWMTVYAVAQFSAVTTAYMQFIWNVAKIPILSAIFSGAFISFSTMSISGVLENRPWVIFAEIPRCLLYFVTEAVIFYQIREISAINLMIFEYYRILYLGTLLFWIAKQPFEKPETTI